MSDMSEMAIPGEPVVEMIMNAMIVYDDVEFASKAQAMLERASHRADAALAWTVKPWRIELLLLPPTAAWALQDAAEAHLIVLAFRRPADPSPRLLDWLENWARRRQVQDAALAVFDGGNGDMLSGTAAPELSLFAERQGLSLIFGDVGPSQDEPALLVSYLRESPVARSGAVEHIVEEFWQSSYEHWGINQ